MVDLNDDAFLEDGDLGGHGQRLDLVMGYIDHGRTGLDMQALQLGAHVYAELCVEVGKRLVHQQQMRLGSDRTSDCNALLLAAGQLGRIAVDVLADLHAGECVLDAAVDLVLGQLLNVQAEGDVLAHGHVRPQSVGLENQVEVALARRSEVSLGSVYDLLAVHEDGAVLRLLQTGYNAQRGGFAAAGRTEQRHEVAVLDGEVNVLQDVVFAVVFINML